MPRDLPTVSRRRVLVGTAALALLGGTVVSACGSTTPAKEVDALLGQLDQARNDSTLAGNAAAAASPKLAPVLTVVAQQRAAHARALSDEITRMSGEAPPAASTTTSTTAAAGSSSAAPAPSAPQAPGAPATSGPPPPKPPTAADVATALQQSADGAALLASQQSGYRAGLLGSISAACTAAATVALANLGTTP